MKTLNLSGYSAEDIYAALLKEPDKATRLGVMLYLNGAMGIQNAVDRVVQRAKKNPGATALQGLMGALGGLLKE